MRAEVHIIGKKTRFPRINLPRLGEFVYIFCAHLSNISSGRAENTAKVSLVEPCRNNF